MHQPPVFRLPGLCSPAVQFVAIMRPDQAPGLPIKYEETTVSQMKKLLGLLLMAGVMAVSSSAISQQAALTAELKERIAPVGGVCMAGDPCAAAPVAAAASGPRSGKEIYDASCNVCHGAGVAGAPKLGDAADWSARLGNGGVETLYTHAIKGFNGMPAMGLCATCSEDEIKLTVDYMLENSK